MKGVSVGHAIAHIDLALATAQEKAQQDEFCVFHVAIIREVRCAGLQYADEVDLNVGLMIKAGYEPG